MFPQELIKLGAALVEEGVDGAQQVARPLKVIIQRWDFNEKARITNRLQSDSILDTILRFNITYVKFVFIDCKYLKTLNGFVFR